MRLCFLAISLLGILGCQQPKNVVVPPIAHTKILALAPELNLNQKPIMGDNGLEALISDFDLLPFELREIQKFPYPELPAEHKKIIYDESPGFLTFFNEYEKLEWGLPIYEKINMPYPQFAKLKLIGKFLNVASQVALERGNTQLCIQLHLAARRLAEKVDQACNTGMAFLVARALSANNERTAHALLEHDKFSLNELKHLLDDYDADTDPVGLEPALKGNWIESAGFIATFPFPQDATSRNREDANFYEGYRGNKNPLNRIKTAEELIKVYRAALIDQDPARADEISAALTVDLNRILERYDLNEDSKARDKALNDWKRTTPNAFGKYLIDLLSPGMIQNYFDSRTSFNVDRDLSRIEIACKLYAIQKGHLPTALDDLKEFDMKRGLTDEFSGEPFGYDPARKIVWSVGRDKVDDNGRDRASLSSSGQSEEGVPKSPQTYDIVVHLK